MPQFIVIELDDTNVHIEDDADQVRRVADLVEESFICGIDKQIRFEKLTTLNHATMHDVVNKINNDAPTFTQSEAYCMLGIHWDDLTRITLGEQP